MDTVAAEVVTELRKTSLPIEVQACMGALSAGELGTWTRPWSPFRCLFGFIEWTGDLTNFPDWPGAVVGLAQGQSLISAYRLGAYRINDGPNVNLNCEHLKEAILRSASAGASFKGSRTTTHAALAWQDEPATWRDVVAANPGIRCDAQGQIAGNWWLAQRDFRNRTGLSLLSELQLGQPDNLTRVANGLYPTWPGGADADFPEVYAATLAALLQTTPAPVPSSDPTGELAAQQAQLDRALAEIDRLTAIIAAQQAEIDRLKAFSDNAALLTALQAQIDAFAAELMKRGVP